MLRPFVGRVYRRGELGYFIPLEAWERPVVYGVSFIIIDLGDEPTVGAYCFDDIDSSEFRCKYQEVPEPDASAVRAMCLRHLFKEKETHERCLAVLRNACKRLENFN